MWSATWNRSQKAAALRSACSTNSSSLWTSITPTICTLPPFSRPLEHGPYGPAEVAGVAALRRVTLARVVDVERHGLAHRRVVAELVHPGLGADAHHADIHGVQALVEVVAGY